jgi:hypothetical protein
MNNESGASGSFGLPHLRLWCFVGFFLFVLVSGCGEGAGEAESPSTEAVPVASFEALYDLSLNRAHSGSGIESYAGLLTIRWADACEGYTSDQHIAADVWNVAGGQMYTEFSSSSWEARDQTVFRFTMTTKLNEEVTREVLGKASRENPSADGVIVFSKPRENKHALGSDVLFPSEYLNRLLEAAQNGDTVFEANMFDGSDNKIIYNTVSFIGAKGNNNDIEDEVEKYPLLAHMDYWPVQASYHLVNTKNELPEFEISMRMYANGITTDLILDYGGFALNGKLLKLNEIKGAGC